MKSEPTGHEFESQEPKWVTDEIIGIWIWTQLDPDPVINKKLGQKSL